MKKINTNKKLRIFNNQTKIINEERQPDEFDDLVDASGIKDVGNILKNLGMTAASIAKLSLKLSVVPVTSYLKNVVWDGKKISFEQFKADYKKLAKDSFKTLGSEIDDLVKDHENNFNNMLRDIGLSKSEANALLAIGSPPLAILNKLYDLSKSKLSGKERFDSNFKDIKEIKNIFRNIIYAYITGKNALTDEDASKLLSKIDTEFNRYFGKVFPEDCLKIIKNLHNKETYKRHFKPIKKILLDAYKSFDFNSGAISSINNAPKNINIDNIVKELNKYFTENKYKNESSYKKSLNLNTMIITEDDDKNNSEETFESEEIRRIGILFTFIYINKNIKAMKNMIIEGSNNIDINKFVNALKDRDTVVNHAVACYVKILTKSAMNKVCKDYLEDPNNYTVDKIKASLDDSYPQVQNFPEEIKKKIRLSLEDYKSSLSDDFKDNKNIDKCMMIISNILKKQSKEEEEELVSLFNWQKFGDPEVFNKFFKVNFLSKNDFMFLKIIQKTFNDIKKIENESKNLAEKIKAYIKEKNQENNNNQSDT